MTEYWFARRYPLGDPRSSMAPVHWKGWLVAAVFVIAMLAGAGAFVWFSRLDRMAEGAAFFTLAAFVGGVFFVTVSRQHGDRVRTVADYKEEKNGA